MREPAKDPAVRRRMAMARYARTHNKSRAARHLGCCWTTIQAAVQRIEIYERTGDISVLQNKSRGKTNRTPKELAECAMDIYQESLDPPRPQNRRYSAARGARLLEERDQVGMHRSTAWRILCRRGVWAPCVTQKVAVQRFERSQPNELWQIDLIEKEPTVRILNRSFKVPDRYIGWSVWVANFFDQYIEIRAGHRTIGTFQL